MRNSKYAKLREDGTLKYAENIIRGKYGVILNPSDKQYIINGYYPVEDKIPPPKKDCRWVKDKWIIEDNKIKATYRAIDAVIYQNCNKEVKLSWTRRIVRAIVYWCAGKTVNF